MCPVSLVGQWIAEAKRCLKDPGMIHAYHGPNRKRDSSVLSQYAIVVTTYAVLNSDATYWLQKSANSSTYVPPCEQIFWWRVVCDESHCMRQSSGQTRAVAAIPAYHKWCVTGTPISTSIRDLLGQLKYIGLDNASEYFNVFGYTVMDHTNDRTQTQRKWFDRRKVGHFTFFMRNVMMRHSMNQKYKNTDTKLMSLPPKVSF